MSTASESIVQTAPPPKTGREQVYVENVKVLFDGFKALDINYFAVNENELRVVIGPNGAGKTTLCDVISGKTPVTEGRIFFGNTQTTKLFENEISALGV